MKNLRAVVSFILTGILVSPGFAQAQEAAKAEPTQKFKLSVVEGASTAKRIKKKRVSAQTVVKVTDQNDAPVAGIAVTFAIPQIVGGGASFATGGLTSVVVTNAAGLASSGSFVAGASSAFSMSVAASVPGGVLTAAVPVNAAAALAAGAGAGAGGAGAGAGGAAAGGAAGGAAGAAAGISAGVIAGVAAGVAAAAVVAAKVATGGKSNSTTSPPSSPTTIGLGGATVGH